MSGRLVTAVFDSALPAWLKPYAAACASFAADDGTQVFPSVLRVARMVGRCERSTQTAIRELRRRGVLRLEARHGRHRATRYVFQEAALPWSTDPTQLPLWPAPAPVSFPQFPQALTGSGLHPMGAVGCTRSVSDPSSLYKFKKRAKKKATLTTAQLERLDRQQRAIDEQIAAAKAR